MSCTPIVCSQHAWMFCFRGAHQRVAEELARRHPKALRDSTDRKPPSLHSSPGCLHFRPSSSSAPPSFAPFNERTPFLVMQKEAKGMTGGGVFFPLRLPAARVRPQKPSLTCLHALRIQITKSGEKTEPTRFENRPGAQRQSSALLDTTPRIHHTHKVQQATRKSTRTKNRQTHTHTRTEQTRWQNAQQQKPPTPGNPPAPRYTTHWQRRKNALPRSSTTPPLE